MFYNESQAKYFVHSLINQVLRTIFEFSGYKKALIALELTFQQ